MNRIVWTLVGLCGYWSTVFAQISVEFKTQDASCSGKGSITVTAKGGRPPYSYEIIGNECGLNNKPLQSSSVFQGLTSCTYTVRVFDADSKSASGQAIVGGNYIGPSATVDVSGCSFNIKPVNGREPLMVSISKDQGKTYGPPSIQREYSGFEEGIYFLKITDACNSIFITSATIQLDPLTFNVIRTNERDGDSLMASNIEGSFGPFQFNIVNGKDTLRSTNNRFSFNDIKKDCNTFWLIKTGCGWYKRPFSYVDAEIACIDVSKGSVEMKINVGTPPYQLTVETFSKQSYTQSGLVLQGMIKNDKNYVMSVRDACGNSSDKSLNYAERPEFDFTTGLNCNQTESASLTIHDKKINDSIRHYTVTCLTCPDNSRKTSSDNFFNFPKLQAGKNRILIEDNCGARWTCNQEARLLIDQSCDQVYAFMVNAFSCDNRPNGTFPSGTVLKNCTFTLKNANGQILASNNTGLFADVPNGNFTIEGSVENCEKAQASFVRNLEIVEPDVFFNVTKFNYDCIDKYFLTADPSFGPYQLLDSSGQNIPLNITNNTYSSEYLVPGRYTLKSLLNCWTKTYDLPAIKSKIKIEDFFVCPAGGRVDVSGARDVWSWRAELKKGGIDLYNVGNAFEWYELHSSTSRYNYDTLRHTFHNIQPGVKYKAYLFSVASYTASEASSCPVDSIEFQLPDYFPPIIESDLSLKCDNTNTAFAQLRISKGTAPYSIQELNCTTGAIFGQAIQTEDSIVAVQNLSINNHCFKVTDACQSVTTVESSVADLNAGIATQKNCDSTTSFFYSNIPGAEYTWEKNGKIVGQNQPLVRLNDPSLGDEITLMINYKGCASTKQFKVESDALNTLKVEIAADKNPLLCSDQTITLSAKESGTRESVTYVWSTGSTDKSIIINEAGWYHVQVKSSIGCTVQDSLEIKKGLPIEIMATPVSVACFGDNTGIITPSIIGGIKPYTYEWSTGAVTQNLSGLAKGKYDLIVHDLAGCTAKKSFEISENTALQPTFNSITLPSCAAASDGQIKVSVTGGTAPYYFKWTNNSSQPLLTNLAPGKYEVTITDSLGCTKSMSTVMEHMPIQRTQRHDTICSGALLRIGASVYSEAGTYVDTLRNRLGCDSLIITSLIINDPISFIISKDDPKCFGSADGTLEVSRMNSQSPYQLFFNGQLQNKLMMNNLSEGTYTVALKDKFGCTAEKKITLINPPPISVNAGRDTLINIGDTIRYKAIFNFDQNQVRSISWSTDGHMVCPDCPSVMFRPEEDMKIKVSLITKNGCQAEDVVELKVIKRLKVFVPNVIYSQDAQRQSGNNYFTIYGDPKFTSGIQYLKIFNRSGALLFEVRDIKINDPALGWDASYNGHPVPSGVYAYLASIKYIDGKEKIIKGDVTVLK